MSQASEQVARQYANAALNKQQWGSVMFNVTVQGLSESIDATSAIQTTINLCESQGGGIVFIPYGRYRISSSLRISKAVYLVGLGSGATSTNPNGAGNGSTSLIWYGASGGTMILMQSKNANEYLFGGGISDILLHGQDIAGTGIRASSTGYMRFANVEGRDFTSQFMRIDADNGVLTQFNEFENIHFVYGASAPVQNANGIVFAGNVSAGVTQNHIISITGLVHSGDLLRFEWSDNNVVEKVHCVALGTGGAVRFANGTGGNANGNVVKYVSGNISAESLSYGNRVLHMIAEGAKITVASGGHLVYDAMDYVNGNVFQTQKFVMSDQLNIPVGNFSVLFGANPSFGLAAAQWASLDYADGVSGVSGCNVMPPLTWNSGTIQTLRLFFSTDTANTSGNARIEVRAITSARNASVVTPEYDVTSSVPVNNSANTLNTADFTLNLAYAVGDSVFISVTRLGADAADTANGKFQLLGALLIYQSNGPTSGGAGPFAVTRM